MKGLILIRLKKAVTFTFCFLHRKGDLRSVNVLCLRDRSRDGTRDISHSLLLSLNVPDVRNVSGKISMAPSSVQMTKW